MGGYRGMSGYWYEYGTFDPNCVWDFKSLSVISLNINGYILWKTIHEVPVKI